MVLPLAVWLGKYKKEMQLYKAASRSNAYARTPNLNIAKAWVEPGTDGELNIFVLETFNQRALCGWYERSVLCSVGNATAVYAMRDA